MLTAFLNELSQRAHSGMLVLEDYHTISSPQVHKTLAFFVEHLPATLHVLIMTRADPPLPLALLRVRNELCEVHAADLRFSHEETQSFLQQAVPSTLSEEAIRQLNAHLEGWAAGLRLLALALQERTNPRELERFLATFAGSHRPLQEYFVGEVLSTQPEPLQDFLLRTSVLSRLTGSLCNTITGRDDSEQLLEALDRGNLFLEPLDESGQWYRYHALFAESMQQEARWRLGVEALRALSHTASLWYEQYDLLAEAVEASLQAQDMARSAELIEQIIGTQHMGFVAQRVNEIQEFHTLRRWLEQLPEALLRQHPALCLSYATVLLFIFASTRVTPITRIQLEELLQMAEQGFRTAGNTAGLGEVFAFHALLARQQGAIIQAVTYARQALAWLPADELAWRSVSLSAEGQEALLKGRLDLARQKLLEALTLCEIMGNHGFTRANTGMLSQISFEQGELHRSSGYLRQMLAEAREEGDRDDIAHAQLGLAQLSYEWNDLQAAERQAQEAFDLGRQFANEEFQVQATLILVRVEHARGETGPALQRLASLLSRLPPRRSPLLSQLAREVLSTQARLQLELGDLAAARRWAASRDQYDEELTLTQQEQEELLVVRLQISQGETQDALDALERWLTTAEEAGRARSALEVQVLMALAHAALKQGQEARQRLQAALSLAQTEGYQRLFLDEGETLATLLRGILAQTREKPLIAYLQTLLRAFASERARAGAQLPPEPASLVEPLSPQEHRVLRLLTAGRSNPEIARELVVSVNTIRTQVQSIYHKLNVNNRVAASEVARNLRLL